MLHPDPIWATPVVTDEDAPRDSIISMVDPLTGGRVLVMHDLTANTIAHHRDPIGELDGILAYITARAERAARKAAVRVDVTYVDAGMRARAREETWDTLEHFGLIGLRHLLTRPKTPNRAGVLPYTYRKA